MRAYLQGYLHGQNDGYHSTLIENKMMDESYDGNLNVEYAPIDQVLEIIDQMNAENNKINGEPIRTHFEIEYNDFRDRVLALRGKQE